MLREPPARARTHLSARRLSMASHDPLDEAINPGGRIIAQDACKRLFLRLHELPEQQMLGVLERLDTAFRASAHNRHVCAGPAGMVHDMLQALPRYKGAAREKVLELLRLLTHQPSFPLGVLPGGDRLDASSGCKASTPLGMTNFRDGDHQHVRIAVSCHVS